MPDTPGQARGPAPAIHGLSRPGPSAHAATREATHTEEQTATPAAGPAEPRPAASTPTITIGRPVASTPVASAPVASAASDPRRMETPDPETGEILPSDEIRSSDSEPTQPPGDIEPAPESAGDDTAQNAMGRRKRDLVSTGDSDDPDGQRIRQALSAVGEVTYEWTLCDDTIQWSDNALDVLQVADISVIRSGRAYAGLLDSENLTSRFDAVMNGNRVDEGSGVAFQVEYHLLPRGRNGDVAHWIEDTGRWYAGADGRPVKVYGVIRIINERHEREQELAYLSSYDPLTGNMNRARLGDALADAITQSERYSRPCAFLLAGVDNLAMVNDAYGFDVADQVISAVSKRLKAKLRAGDCIGRYAGNKFGVILGNCNEHDMQVAANRLLGAARETVIETTAGPVSATVSIGGVLIPKTATTAQDAMVRAEESLSQAKARHRDTFVAYKHSTSRDSLRKRNIVIADEIVQALNERRLTLAYQPIVHAADGTPALYECLLRMIKADNEIVSAGHMIPIAEQLGLVRLLDHRVLEMAVAALEETEHTRLTLNISGMTTVDPAWLANLTAYLNMHRNLAERLVVEITETVAIHDIEETTSFVNGLRDLGCQVAIDDFGAGYTSFKNLKQLNVDMVKIDGAFVKNLRNEPDDQFFVRTLIELARNFNLKTVAEWVTTEEDAALLRSWGIDYLQGHLFGAAEVRKPWESAGEGPTGAAAAREGADDRARDGVDSAAPGAPPLTG